MTNRIRHISVNRCKEVLIYCGCGTCGRRLVCDGVAEKWRGMFVFGTSSKYPRDVICESCVRNQMQAR